MNAATIRHNRIVQLYNMYVRTEDWEQVRDAAYHLASKKTADEYLDEVMRRVMVAKEKNERS